MVQADQVDDSLTGNRTVCIIDSGYDLGHPDLPGGSNVSGYDGNLTWFEDGSGHGTHVAGTTATDGSVSLSSSDTKGRLKYELCVDSVSHGSLTYDSSANGATCVTY